MKLLEQVRHVALAKHLEKVKCGVVGTGAATGESAHQIHSITEGV